MKGAPPINRYIDRRLRTKKLTTSLERWPARHRHTAIDRIAPYCKGMGIFTRVGAKSPAAEDTCHSRVSIQCHASFSVRLAILFGSRMAGYRQANSASAHLLARAKSPRLLSDCLPIAFRLAAIPHRASPARRRQPHGRIPGTGSACLSMPPLATFPSRAKGFACSQAHLNF